MTNVSTCSLDLVLLACNWSTMGDSFFVCHHLAALYAYGYVLVSGSFFWNRILVDFVSFCFLNSSSSVLFALHRPVVSFPTLPISVSFLSYPHHLWTKGESSSLVNMYLSGSPSHHMADISCSLTFPNGSFSSRWFFEALKYPRSHRLVVLNGVAMAVVFFLVRIAVMPSYWASVFATFGTPEFERLGLGAQVAWITSCIALDVLNIIWMHKITRGCYKVLTGRGGRKVKVEAEASSSLDKKHTNNHTDWGGVEHSICRHRQ